MLRKFAVAADMLIHDGPEAFLKEARVRSARVLRGRSIADHFTQFARYGHPDGQRIPLYVGYRDYLKPLHVLAHATAGGMRRYVRDNQESHVQATGLGGAVVFLRLLRELGFEVTGKRILDVGCGDGALAFLLASHGATVTGIELEERPQSWEPEHRRSVFEVLMRSGSAGTIEDYSELSARVQLVAMDVQRPSIEERFDLILSNSVLEHIRDLRTGLTNMRRMLEPGGAMVHLFNPFFSENGGHEWCILDFPWGHVRLSRAEFSDYLTTYRGWEFERALEIFDGSFNDPKFTLDEIDGIAGELGMQCAAQRERRSCWWESDTDRNRILSQCRRTYPAVTWRDLTSESVLRVWKV